MIKIGIDAMGGDFAPEVAVEGAVMALKKVGKDSRIVLFGDKERILELLKKHKCSADNFDIVGTTEVIEMHDHPAKAFASKKDSSMTVGFNYLKEGKIDGFASAGSTGAMMVGSQMVIKTIEGVIRPVISTFIPIIKNKRGILLDVGLNVDAKPEVLAQYGLMGSIYANAVLGIENPRVALLNIGEEDTKGNAQSKAAFELLKADKNINFVGNCESSYIFTGKYCDVVVSDGFVGNVILKMAGSVSYQRPSQPIQALVAEAPASCTGAYLRKALLAPELLELNELRERGWYNRDWCKCTCDDWSRRLNSKGYLQYDPYDGAQH